MLRNIINQKGNIGIALVVIIVAVMSGISMASIAFRDTVGFRNQLDGVQQLHFIRSEVGRGRFMAGHLESMDNPPRETVLPTRTINVEFGKNRTVYSVRTKLSIYEDLYDTGYLIRTLISAVRGASDTQTESLQSPVKRYSENKIRSLQSLAIFHYFSDIDREKDDVPGNIRFFGNDVVHGRVHSNTDIYILQNTNPTFHGLVSTAGEIKDAPNGGRSWESRRQQIFRGRPIDLIEGYRRIAFEPNASIVRSSGNWPLGRTERDDAIAFVTVEGSGYEIFLGEIIEDTTDEWIEGQNQFTIYTVYPPYGPVGDSIGINRIPRKDTVWRNVAGGAISNNSAFIPMQMWISGNFAGRQTWASSHDIYLKDDLTYQRTTPGMPPDGRDINGNVIHPVNTTDFLGIISEGSIIIQYGYRDPIDSTRHRPNTQSIYMYGAYAAVGDGDYPWQDGVFTYQYQFPKGSTPRQYWLGELFGRGRDQIDLHLFHYPTTSTNPWPPGLDYPWYNPLWPEPGEIYNVGFRPGFPFPANGRTPNPHNAPEIVKLRGAINLFGSVAQRRRGYVRRSGNFDFDTGIWDVENVIEPNTPPRYGSPNPGITPTGYDKNYSFDHRFERTGPPHFPLVKFEGYDTDELMDLGYITLSWVFKKPPSSF